MGWGGWGHPVCDTAVAMLDSTLTLATAEGRKGRHFHGVEGEATL